MERKKLLSKCSVSCREIRLWMCMEYPGTAQLHLQAKATSLPQGVWEEKGTEEHEEIRSSGEKDLDGPQGNMPPYAARIRTAD